MNAKSAIVAFAAMLGTTAAMAQTITKEQASAQGTAMGTAYNLGAGLISSGIGAIGNALKGAVMGTTEAAPAATQATSMQAVTTAIAAAKPPALPAGTVEGFDEHYARTPRASFEAAVEKALAILPEERRADVKTTAMADYDGRVARYNANRDQVNAALPIALNSVNSALKTALATAQPQDAAGVALPASSNAPAPTDGAPKSQ